MVATQFKSLPELCPPILLGQPPEALVGSLVASVSFEPHDLGAGLAGDDCTCSLGCSPERIVKQMRHNDASWPPSYGRAAAPMIGSDYRRCDASTEA